MALNMSLELSFSIPIQIISGVARNIHARVNEAISSTPLETDAKIARAWTDQAELGMCGGGPGGSHPVDLTMKLCSAKYSWALQV